MVPSSKITGQIFQSTCPARGTTLVFAASVLRVEFQSTCPARGTTVASSEPSPHGGISIHVPREGHDSGVGWGCCWGCYFNPRAPRGARRSCERAAYQAITISIHVPREGHDSTNSLGYEPNSAFQSTCPARGTTNATIKALYERYDFNPRAPRGARHEVGRWMALGLAISIHVPREGHDFSLYHRAAY